MKIFGKTFSYGTIFGFFAAIALAAYVPYAVTSGADKQRVEWVRIENSGGTASTKSQSGSWVASYTNPATGKIAVTITSGVFSAAPSCLCVVADGDINGFCYQNGTVSSTSATFQTRTDAGSNSNSDVDVICFGPR